MPAKGVINKDVIAGNKFQFLVAGVQLTVTAVEGLEEVLKTIDLPDGTRASGGRTEASEFTVRIPKHHTVEFAFFEAWYREGKDPVLATAYKPVTVLSLSNSNAITRTSSLFGCFITGRTEPDKSLEDGSEEMAEVEYTISVDDQDHV